MSGVIVLNDKYSPSYDPSATCPVHGDEDHGDCAVCQKAARKKDPKWEPQVSVEEALGSRYDYDAYVVMYSIDGEPTCPRLGKASPLSLQASGLKLRMRLMLLDIDGPNHTATPAWRAHTLKAISALPYPTAWYETKNGMRVCWACDLSLHEWTEQRAILVRSLKSAGVEADPEAKGWYRLHRTPYIRRDGRVETPRTFGLAQLPPLPSRGLAQYGPGHNPFSAIGEAQIPLNQTMRSTTTTGSRNNTLTRIAGRLRLDGVSIPMLRQRLIDHNETRFTSPIPRCEIEAILESAQAWTSHVDAREAANPNEEPFSRADPLTTGSERELLERIRDDLQATREGAPLIHAEGGLHRWRLTQWRPLTAETVRNLVGMRYERWPVNLPDDKDGNPRTKPAIISHNKATAVAKMLQDALAAESEHIEEGTSWFDHAPKGAPFQNGWLSTDRTLTPHQYTNRNQHVLQAAYKPNSVPDLFINKLLRGCLRDHSNTEGTIQMLREWFGLALLGQSTRYQTALMFSGGGNNGKSTILNVILNLFQGRSCSLTPQAMADPRCTPLLKGAHLNVITECPSADLMVSEEIKAAISGDPITANPKHQQPYTFRPKAGMVFAANELPPVRDMTDGFFRRFMVVDFNRRFLPSEVDRHLEHVIKATEMDEVASWLVDGGLDALSRDSLFVPPEVRAATQKWRSSANKVSQFIEEHLQELIAKPPMTGSQLYQRFKMWHMDTGGAARMMGRTTFYKKLAYVTEATLVRNQSNGSVTVQFQGALKEVATPVPPTGHQRAPDSAQHKARQMLAERAVLSK